MATGDEGKKEGRKTRSLFVTPIQKVFNILYGRLRKEKFHCGGKVLLNCKHISCDDFGEVNKKNIQQNIF